MKPVISVIIVAYKNMDCLKECLESIKNHPRIEMIVVNNSHQNRGFGAGCNLGASFATGETLLFLNPDTIASQESILAIADELLEDDSIGILGPALTDDAGKVVLSISQQPTKKNFWIVYSLLNSMLRNSAVVRSHWYNHQPPKQSKDVGVVSGAAMGMRKTVFEKIGGFDEQYFLYWEEVDLARRCLKKGLRIVFQPSIKMLHHGGLSTVQGQERIMVWFRESRHYFMKKYYGQVYAGIVEGWLALSEHWQLSIVLLGLFSLSFRGDFILAAGAMVMATMLYNELVIEWGKTWASMVGFFVGFLAVMGFFDGYYLLAAGIGWIMFDLIKQLSPFRRLYVAIILIGSLC